MTLRWFWRVYLVVVSVALLGVPLVAFGPAIELAVAPVLTAQTITGITRERGAKAFDGHAYFVDRICWTWERVKQRPISYFSTNIDVFVDSHNDVSSSTIYNKATGAAWAVSSAVAPGTNTQEWCADLPPHVSIADHVRVRQTAYYPGWLGIWELPVRLPDVVDPPGAPAP